MIRKSIAQLIYIGLGLFLIGVSPVLAEPASRVGRLNYIEGSVSFRPGSLDDWTDASLNFPLSEGDQLWTDQTGRAEIHVGSMALRLGATTDFSFLKLDDALMQISLTTGALNLKVRRFDAGDSIEIDTPNGPIAIEQSGSYRIDVQADGQATKVIVYEGQVSLSTETGELRVGEGQTGTISGADALVFAVQTATPLDDLDEWCITRDTKENQHETHPFISPETIGVEDLDDYGTWATVSDYGPVWRPHRVPDGWAPYKFGRWAWVEPWGWTWIDAAPWGFAPSHYGRWAYVRDGWVWVPGPRIERPVYAPALVVFVGGESWRPRGASCIAWFPLAPREVYIPPYPVTTVYLQRINIENRTITLETVQREDFQRQHYHNRDVPHGLSVLDRQDFMNAHPVQGHEISLSASDRNNAPIMGSIAKIAPQRQSLLAPSVQPIEIRRPTSDLLNRRVLSNRQLPAPPVPFEARQTLLLANPGRPVDLGALIRLQTQNSARQPAVKPTFEPHNEGNLRPVQPSPIPMLQNLRSVSPPDQKPIAGQIKPLQPSQRPMERGLTRPQNLAQTKPNPSREVPYQGLTNARPNQPGPNLGPTNRHPGKTDQSTPAPKKTTPHPPKPEKTPPKTSLKPSPKPSPEAEKKRQDNQ